jgi:citrate lyase subunit beta/citryl-CoA lyase
VTDLRLVRSFLFAPGDDERKLTNALASDADAVIADLEDGVGRDHKDDARACVSRVFAETPRGRALRLIRVNPGDDNDLLLGVELELDAIVLPKATPESVASLGLELPPVLALVETAAGIRSAEVIASDPRVVALMLGSLDLAAELGLPRDADSPTLTYAAAKLVLDSAAAGIAAPVDGVFADTRDADGLAAEIERARRIGFRGKACIHPGQIAAVNRGFGSSPEEVTWARSALDAFERAEASGTAVASLEGEMVDLPVVLRARRILELADRSG